MKATLLMPAGVTSMASIKFKDEDEIISKQTKKGKTIEEAYVNDILPNFPKKEIILKQNIEKNEFQLIENIFAYNINNSVRIKEKYMKDILINLSMYNYYVEISYHKKYINNHKLKCITRMLMEMRKIAYGIIRSNQNAVQ